MYSRRPLKRGIWELWPWRQTRKRRAERHRVPKPRSDWRHAALPRLRRRPRSAAPHRSSRPASAKGVESARSFFEEHGRTLLLGIGGGALVAVLGLTISAYFDKQSREAADLLFAGVEAAKAPVIDPAKAAELPDDAEESFPTVEARAKKAREEFEKVGKQYPRSDAAELGRCSARPRAARPRQARRGRAGVPEGRARTPTLRSVTCARARSRAPASRSRRSRSTPTPRSASRELAELDKGAYKPLARVSPRAHAAWRRASRRRRPKCSRRW